MTLVRIVKSWQKPDLLRQTPKGLGIWDDVRFTLEPLQQCDYLIILNRYPEDVVVRCPTRHVWAIIQEPPIRQFQWLVKELKEAHRIYSPDTTLTEPQFVHSHGALPWHVDKSYDELINAPIPDKSRNLSWITSNLTHFKGHGERMNFLKQIRRQVEFDLWGRGFTQIADKWDGLAHWRYALAIENYSGPYYWTEKVVDCFLSWTMPLYYGCTNLKEYFPEESFITIDIHAPDVSEQINDIIKSNQWKQSLDAIAHARELALNRHQLFPFVTERIHQEQQNCTLDVGKDPSSVLLKGVRYTDKRSRLLRLRHHLRRIISQYRLMWLK